MTIMVTGGTGFIGARIIRKLLERGQEVVSFDLAPPRPTLDSRMNAVPFYRGDVTDMAHLMEAVNTHQVSRIIHLAALLPPTSENRPGHGLRVNIQGANNVFEVARWTQESSASSTPAPSPSTASKTPSASVPLTRTTSPTP